MDVAFRALGVDSKAEKKPPKDLRIIEQRLTRRQPTLTEKLAAAYYCWSFGYAMYCWIAAIWLCAHVPILWPLLGLYTAYIWKGPGRNASGDGSWPMPWRRWSLWRACASYFDAKLHKTSDLPPDRPYIFGYHPHGILAFGGWLAFGTEALGFSRLFPGIDLRILTLNINFRAPALREYLLLHGVCDVNRESCLRLLGLGKSVFIAVGGATESLYARPGHHELVLNRRKGFVRIALQSGAALVPTYSFGEVDTFRTANELPRDSRLRQVQRLIEKLTGFTVPLYFGTGILTSVGFLPYPVQLNVVVGAPIDVPKYEGDVDSAEFRALVDKYHGQYVAALRKLFDDNKESYAKGEGDLQIVE